MVLCALTVDLDAYTGAETPFLLLIRFLSLNLYWNPSQAIIHMRMVYLLWAYISFFCGKPHHFHFKSLITILEFIAMTKWQKWVLIVNTEQKILQDLLVSSSWLYNLKDWILFPWLDVENPFAGREMWAAVGIFVVRKTFCWVKCWQAGGTPRHHSTPPPHPRLRLSGVSYIWGISEGEGDRSPITGW